MRTRSLVLIIGLLTLSLLLIGTLRWLALSYVRNLESPRLDRLQGRWEVTWDRGTDDEMSAVFALDRVTMRQFSFYVTEDGVVTFYDDEGCFHTGQVGEDGQQIAGYYSQCRAYPDWIGRWEAVRR